MKNDTAMTGEISLRGLVLLHWRRQEQGAQPPCAAGITTVLLPERNKKRLSRTCRKRRAQAMKFVWLSTVDDAIAAARS